MSDNGTDLVRGLQVLVSHGIDPIAAIDKVHQFFGPEADYLAISEATAMCALDYEEIPAAHTVDSLAPWLCDNRGGRWPWAGPVNTPQYSLAEYRQSWREMAQHTLDLWQLIGLEASA